MTHTLFFNNSIGLMIAKTKGSMTAEDYIKMAEDILASPRCVPNSSMIFDHRELDFTHVTLEELNKIREFHMRNEDEIGCGKTAIVVKTGYAEEWNKLWSQGQKIKTGNITRVFEDMKQAIAWVKVID